MKYEKCPVCEEKLRNGICPMCGYDFNRLGQSRTLKDGHKNNSQTKKKSKKGKWAIILVVIYLLQFLADVIPDFLYNIEDFINQILTGFNL